MNQYAVLIGKFKQLKVSVSFVFISSFIRWLWVVGCRCSSFQSEWKFNNFHKVMATINWIWLIEKLLRCWFSRCYSILFQLTAVKLNAVNSPIPNKQNSTFRMSEIPTAIWMRGASHVAAGSRYSSWHLQSSTVIFLLSTSINFRLG